MRKRSMSLLAGSALAALLLSTPASAQLNNRPFAFKSTPDGRVGMSLAGQQAILNEKLTGARPTTLFRGPGGQLLDIQRAAGGRALVQEPGGGNFFPGIRTRDGFSFASNDLRAGVFNAFFIPDNDRSNYPLTMFQPNVVSSWTSQVAGSRAGVAVGLSSANPVDAWTSAVHLYH